ncbi:hypothetical protein P9112_008802 [Eukaryota sp. TZLM1-RC]
MDNTVHHEQSSFCSGHSLCHREYITRKNKPKNNHVLYISNFSPCTKSIDLFERMSKIAHVLKIDYFGNRGFAFLHTKSAVEMKKILKYHEKLPVSIKGVKLTIRERKKGIAKAFNPKGGF